MEGIISFTSCPYYTVNKRLSGPWGWSGRSGKERSSCWCGACNSIHLSHNLYATPTQTVIGKLSLYILTHRAHSSTVSWGTALQAGRSWVQFPMVSVGFFIDIILLAYSVCPDPACKLSAKPVWCIPLVCMQWKTPDDGQRNCLKHVELHSK